ncbi:terpene synthase family protein [Streptomyces sp. R28]|uniref:Terpene synthase family protein n=1 Tax=Streptomyces sp. R28 TaxID=3238628 RepID=A0AB39QHA1_9ACTN
MRDEDLVGGPGALDAFIRTVDRIGLAFVMDDQLSGPGVQAPGLVVRIIEGVTAVTSPAHGTSAPSMPAQGGHLGRLTLFIRVWRGLWRDLCARMSQDWQARSARNWADFFATFPLEDHNHRNGIILDIDSYRALRCISVGVEPFLDMGERVGGFEVPARTQDSAWMRRMRYAASDAIARMNDVHGMERGEPHRDAHNHVLLLEHVPRLCAPLDLNRRERDAVARFTEALCIGISGERNRSWPPTSPLGQHPERYPLSGMHSR